MLFDYSDLRSRNDARGRAIAIKIGISVTRFIEAEKLTDGHEFITLRSIFFQHEREDIGRDLMNIVHQNDCAFTRFVDDGAERALDRLITRDLTIEILRFIFPVARIRAPKDRVHLRAVIVKRFHHVAVDAAVRRTIELAFVIRTGIFFDLIVCGNDLFDDLQIGKRRQGFVVIGMIADLTAKRDRAGKLVLRIARKHIAEHEKRRFGIVSFKEIKDLMRMQRMRSIIKGDGNLLFGCLRIILMISRGLRQGISGLRRGGLSRLLRILIEKRGKIEAPDRSDDEDRANRNDRDDPYLRFFILIHRTSPILSNDSFPRDQMRIARISR